MVSIALYRPEIPPNTGNIARLCAANNLDLHIVGQAAFRMDAAAVKRAGLDYWPHVKLTQHAGWEEFRAALPHLRVILFTTKATRPYTGWTYGESDCLVFGPETTGLPQELREEYAANCLTIPMANPAVRSLNLANSVAIVAYEAMRQLKVFG